MLLVTFGKGMSILHGGDVGSHLYWSMAALLSALTANFVAMVHAAQSDRIIRQLRALLASSGDARRSTGATSHAIPVARSRHGQDVSRADGRSAAGVPEWTPDEVRQRTSNGGGYTLVDVREKEEYREGHLPGAVSVPRGFLDMRIEETVPDKSAPIIALLRRRHALAARRPHAQGDGLHQRGLDVGRLRRLEGRRPSRGWRTASSPPTSCNRYSRHFLLPEVGEAGQAKLLDAKVLLIGAGGLGSPTAFYLAAAGVGTLGIVDIDVVDVSNLQRQILHTNDRVGMPKVESAQKTLNALNPDVKVIGYQERVTLREHHAS